MDPRRKKFEVAVYNREVRQCVADGRHHRDLKDSWADIHYIEIWADEADEARRRIAARYPAEKGYEIVAVSDAP